MLVPRRQAEGAVPLHSALCGHWLALAEAVACCTLVGFADGQRSHGMADVGGRTAQAVAIFGHNDSVRVPCWKTVF